MATYASMVDRMTSLAQLKHAECVIYIIPNEGAKCNEVEHGGFPHNFRESSEGSESQGGI